MTFAPTCGTSPSRLPKQISAEDARFESLVSQLKIEQDSKLEHRGARLRLANKLLEFTAWHDRVRAQLVALYTQPY